MNPTTAGLSGADAALRTVEIPDYWTPEQTLAVWDLLNELADRIWARYETQLVEMIRANLEHEDQDNQPDLFDPDDPIPF